MIIPDPQSQNLRRLLACKRHEKPPPGYFYEFSERVISRLDRDYEEPLSKRSWWARLSASFDPKLAVVCAYATAVSSLLLTGFKLSQIPSEELQQSHALNLPRFAIAPRSTGDFASESRRFSFPQGHVLSASAVFALPPSSTAFSQSGGLVVEPTAFNLGGR